MNTNTLAKSKWPRVLAFAVIALVFFIGMGLATSAHAAGTYSLTVQYNPGVNVSDEYTTPAMPEIFNPTPITVYKVGDHARDSETGKAYFSLAQELVPSVKLPTMGKEDEGWLKEWLKAAETVRSGVMGNGGVVHDAEGAEYPKYNATIPVGSDPSVTISSLSPGLYLVVGEGQKYSEAGEIKYWYPQPMLVQILQADTTITLKPVIRPAIAKIKINKGWTDEGKQQYRPDSIKMHLTYGDDAEGAIDVELKAPKYTAEVNVDPAKDNPLEWTVTEDDPTGNYQVDLNYAVTSDPKSGETTITFTVNNIYNRHTLKLIKDLPIYVQHANGDKVDTVFTFELNGYKLGEDGKEQTKPVFHKIVALQFSEAGQQELEVPEIPRGLSRLEVKELKHVNYKAVAVEDEDEDVQDPYVKNAVGPNNDGVYTVSFKNDWDGNVHYEGSAINHYKYEKGKYAFDFTKGIVRKN